MGKITLELGEDQQQPFACLCCGGLVYSSYGYIYSDDSAHAVYFAQWTDGNHPDSGVTVLISLGEWHSDVPRTGARASMALRAWVLDGDVVYTVLDADRTRWSKHQTLGTMLTREQAQAHSDKGEFFHLAEHVTGDDPKIRAFLQAERS